MDDKTAYKEALERAKSYYESPRTCFDIDALTDIFPELKESDEKIRGAIIDHLKDSNLTEWAAWLEKQAEQKSIMNVPSREVILSIWDLGNEWKELTNGSISTEYGTQLDYIQKHWHESEYYLREKQGEQKPQRMISAEAKEAMYAKPAWSEEDEVKINRIVACLENLNVADNDILLKDVDWLKSLKQRLGG